MYLLLYIISDSKMPKFKNSIIVRNNHAPQLRDNLVITSHAAHQTIGTLNSTMDDYSEGGTLETNGRVTMTLEDEPEYINMEAGMPLRRAISTTSLVSKVIELPQQHYNVGIVKLVKLIFILILSSALLVSTTLSKVSFVAIASKLYTTIYNGTNITENSSLEDKRLSSITLIQLITVLMVPQVVTIVRMFFAGIIGKSQKNYPWPTCGAILTVSKCIIPYIYNIIHMA